MGDQTHWETIPDTIHAHLFVKQSSLTSFHGLRIPVNIQLLLNREVVFFSDYHDLPLLDLIELGFPLDVDRSGPLGIESNTYLGRTFELHYPSVDDIAHNKLRPATQRFFLIVKMNYCS